ncbi:hypothetical protein D7223_01195 [Micromonospora endolithica]|uniref:Creatininase family protein n=1 Tax=Micromonospora endolithica TaxID=230091 RepID=A0A3A9ZQC6_9ACTN|nr:creatininase family protein [Micromonospora endolithica]RKN50442.1 hypothetical protein D7223_01195 [Micromonospora endolithica]
MTPWTIATAADEAGRRATVAVLPIGSFEQHGPQLPLATDTIVASAIATALAERYDTAGAATAMDSTTSDWRRRPNSRARQIPDQCVVGVHDPQHRHAE